jgi:hypothetical protein
MQVLLMNVLSTDQQYWQGIPFILYLYTLSISIDLLRLREELILCNMTLFGK